MNFKNAMKPLLVAGLVVIGVGGLVGICIVLFGILNDITFKMLASSLAIGYYAVTVACTFGEGRAYIFTGLAGVAVAICGLAFTLPTIWFDEWWRADIPFRAMSSAALVAFAVAHGTTNYRLSNKSAISLTAMVAANFCVTILTLMFLTMILDKNFRLSGDFLQILIAFCIATVVLTIMNPMVSKLSKT